MRPQQDKGNVESIARKRGLCRESPLSVWIAETNGKIFIVYNQ